MKPTCALSCAAHDRRRILEFKTRYTQTIAVHPTLIYFSSNATEKSLDKLQEIMTRIVAVGLNHARTLAKLLDQENSAARGHTGNNSDTQKTGGIIFSIAPNKRHNFEFPSRHGYKSDFVVSFRIILNTDSPNKPRLSEIQFVLLRIAGIGAVLCMLASATFLPE